MCNKLTHTTYKNCNTPARYTAKYGETNFENYFNFNAICQVLIYTNFGFSQLQKQATLVLTLAPHVGEAPQSIRVTVVASEHASSTRNHGLLMLYTTSPNITTLQTGASRLVATCAGPDRRLILRPPPSCHEAEHTRNITNSKRRRDYVYQTDRKSCITHLCSTLVTYMRSPSFCTKGN